MGQLMLTPCTNLDSHEPAKPNAVCTCFEAGAAWSTDGQGITRVEILLDPEKLNLIDELKAIHGCHSRTEIINRLLHDPAVIAALDAWRPPVTT